MLQFAASLSAEVVGLVSTLTPPTLLCGICQTLIAVANGELSRLGRLCKFLFRFTSLNGPSPGLGRFGGKLVWFWFLRFISIVERLHLKTLFHDS